MPEVIHINDGDDLEGWRKRLKLSKSSGAQLLGCSRTTFYRYLTGRVPLPKAIGRKAELIEIARTRPAAK